MSLFSIFLKGGSLMWVLLALSMAAVAIIIKKYRVVLNVNKLNDSLKGQLSEATSLQSAMSIVASFQDTCPLSSVLNKVGKILNTEYPILKDSTEAAANMAIHKLERGLGWLSTISAIAPLVGFLGTVTGMVSVFMNIQTHSANGIDVTYLSGGIWEALLTTVGGLVIGIITIIFYNDLVQHIEDNAKFLQSELDAFLLMYRDK
jgi:biopolymer transport protein ExbB